MNTRKITKMRKKEYDLQQLLLYDQLMEGLSDAEIKKCLKKECLIKDHDE